MTDDVDNAQRREEEMRTDALAEQARKTAVTRPSAEWCEAPGCGERIPEARRLAVPGVRYCVECQESDERTRGRYVAN